MARCIVVVGGGVQPPPSCTRSFIFSFLSVHHLERPFVSKSLRHVGCCCRRGWAPLSLGVRLFFFLSRSSCYIVRSTVAYAAAGFTRGVDATPHPRRRGAWRSGGTSRKWAGGGRGGPSRRHAPMEHGLGAGDAGGVLRGWLAAHGAWACVRVMPRRGSSVAAATRRAPTGRRHAPPLPAANGRKYAYTHTHAQRLPPSQLRPAAAPPSPHRRADAGHRRPRRPARAPTAARPACRRQATAAATTRPARPLHVAHPPPRHRPHATPPASPSSALASPPPSTSAATPSARPPPHSPSPL